MSETVGRSVDSSQAYSLCFQRLTARPETKPAVGEDEQDG